ncbi:MAG: 50S ribosomal protein L13 [Candidatus Berkelbacteria bacterium]|nr:50S ribosomal protein L13 [Candidatus Berkelbacteria bacterium]
MEEKIYLIDASARPLGRMATEIAELLRGKNLPSFRPNVLPNAVVVVINAEKVFLSGNKESSKQYFSYSGFHGGIKMKKFSELKKSDPKEIIRKAVWGMLPKNKLQTEFIKKLKIFLDANHPYDKEKVIVKG